MRISDWSSDVCSSDLRHRDAAQRESRRVIAQGDPVQCAEGITRRERPRRGRDQRVHRNPATLVTPTVRCADAKFIPRPPARSEEHTSELHSLMRISYALFCLKKQKTYNTIK